MVFQNNNPIEMWNATVTGNPDTCRLRFQLEMEWKKLRIANRLHLVRATNRQQGPYRLIFVAMDEMTYLLHVSGRRE